MDCGCQERKSACLAQLTLNGLLQMASYRDEVVTLFSAVMLALKSGCRWHQSTEDMRP